MKIIGAGLAGLIAGYAFPNCDIIEANGPAENHKALLRFRSDAVSRITNIPFRKVTVRKGIYSFRRGSFVEPNIAIVNEYSRKVINSVQGRSIWNLDPVERFIAPEDFYQQMVEHHGNRICWNTAVDVLREDFHEPIISTIPLSSHSVALNSTADFRRRSIKVHRYRITDADVFQTVYFHEMELPLYRASITGDILIAESMDGMGGSEFSNILADVFGLDKSSITEIDSGRQRFGKIAEIDENERRRMVVELTRDYSIYSLGRFATWRNILLDDVVNDIDVIKRLLRADEYQRTIIERK